MNTDNKLELLERALKLLGPDGENWIKQDYELDGGYCLAGAIGQAAIDAGFIQYTDDDYDEDEARYEGFGYEGEFSEVADRLTTEVSLDCAREGHGVRPCARLQRQIRH